MLKQFTSFMEAQKPQLDLLKVVTPSDNVEQKNKWIASAEKGHFTNPVLHYSDNRDAARASTLELNALERQLPKAISPTDIFIRSLIVEAIRQQCLVNTIAISVYNGDDSLTSGLLRDYHGATSDEIKQIAYTLADGDKSILACGTIDDEKQKLSAERYAKAKSDIYNAEDIKKLFKAVLEDYGLLGEWTVVVDDTYSSVTVKTYDPNGASRIYIPASKTASEVDSIKLAGHEVECHVRHNMNCAGILQQLGFPSQVARYLVSNRDATLTEGYAKVSDMLNGRRMSGKTIGAPLPWYIIAADMASKGESFAHVAEYLHSKGRSVEQCWNTTIRIFRGCHDTANMHHYAREADRCYLEGYLKAKSNLDNPLFDFAKFDKVILDKIHELIGEFHATYPFQDICGKIITYMS